ncbi:MAG TPA: hypothetical protein VNI77_09870 [Nitrososphaera sp.]|nr:hypothetical protein [Nitrososphaera sp.]
MNKKNLMERFILQVKDRTECFDDYFLCRKRNCNRKHVWNCQIALAIFGHGGRQDAVHIISGQGWRLS